VRYIRAMGRRISVYLDEEVLELLNQHTQASPLSRSELVGVAVRRFLRDERRRVRVPALGNELARLIAAGDLPSRRLDGARLSARGAPWEN
jgi:metal-responsive CopG/Arc/MetJ family transcriptional regulator